MCLKKKVQQNKKKKQKKGEMKMLKQTFFMWYVRVGWAMQGEQIREICPPGIYLYKLTSLFIKNNIIEIANSVFQKFGYNKI